ncbi:DNA double-strand break repair nuclease NurA [Natronorarus salvus]|uniref:DNA double-strand break repair nuclease NurA n=1 Tax=Natronorarus salvus TaxID=3117733 RepID=UPI002F267834
MTLDPVHAQGIVRLARQVGRDVDDGEGRAFAETVWERFLSPLTDGSGRVVLEPIGEQYRGRADCEDLSLTERPFETSHGVDSGTINPTTFKNGVVLDAAHAAVGSVPSDLDTHRARSVVLALHFDDVSKRYGGGGWRPYDEGFAEERIVHVRGIDRYTEPVVHALALYLAEGYHALRFVDRIDDLLYLDGPLYPKGLLNWRALDSHLETRLEEGLPLEAVENYVHLVESALDRGVPLVGFVKNPASRTITRTLREKLAKNDETGIETRWSDDTGLFVRLLERRAEAERLREALTFTNWFRSRSGADRAFASDGDALGIRRRYDPESYEVSFFLIYDPRDDVLYKVEAPYGLTREEGTREALTRQVLSEVAAQRGPPEAIAKADELARIRSGEKRAITRMIERETDSEARRTYDDVRWAEGEF